MCALCMVQMPSAVQAGVNDLYITIPSAAQASIPCMAPKQLLPLQGPSSSSSSSGAGYPGIDNGNRAGSRGAGFWQEEGQIRKEREETEEGQGANARGGGVRGG